MIQWVQGVWFLIILRAFYIKMSRVASRIYALLSVIRQQMSPFDPFRGGGRQKGTMSPFFTVFFLGDRPLEWKMFGFTHIQELVSSPPPFTLKSRPKGAKTKDVFLYFRSFLILF